MSMSKADFTIVANAIRQEFETNTDGEARVGIVLVAGRLAQSFGQAYPRFDAQRFLAACLPTHPLADSGNFEAIVVGITRIENSLNGNPRWEFATAAGGRYKTRPGASFAYELTGNETVPARWTLVIDGRNNIVTGREVHPL